MLIVQLRDLLEFEDLSVLKDPVYGKPLMYLYMTDESRLDVTRVNSMSEINNHSTLRYVYKTFQSFEEQCLRNVNDEYVKRIVQEVLIWSEVSKGGLEHKRKEWKSKGYNLNIHNIGSAEIFNEDSNLPTDMKIIISTLIRTHGLIGQYIKGEINLSQSAPLRDLVVSGVIDKETLKEILTVLNKAIIEGVSESLYETIEEEVFDAIFNVLNGDFYGTENTVERIKKLRMRDDEDLSCLTDNQKRMMSLFFASTSFWYVTPATKMFNINEFIKMFGIIFSSLGVNISGKDLSFESLMHEIHYDYKGKKATNLYKKRIIEKLLKDITFEEISMGKLPENEHVSFCIESTNSSIEFKIKFSEMSNKLIEFCEMAEKSNIPEYEKAIIMLYDLLGFRKDDYDWFHNESEYLETMNSSVGHKSIILDHIVGTEIVDVGPGGGALMNLIEEKLPNANVTGIDIATNVIEDLLSKKHKECRKWNVKQGDILQASKTLGKEKIDTMIFSSIIHELYSYIPFNGKKFNHDTIVEVIKNSLEVLKSGGRIVIRDGVMSDENPDRLLFLRTNDRTEFFKRYVNDFKGRDIQWSYHEDGKDIIRLPQNDAMEFMYTYTWGQDSYVREVQEQFGYLSKSGFYNLIEENFKEVAEIVHYDEFLQEGYQENISKTIDYMDINENSIDYPNSTCVVVIQKK